MAGDLIPRPAANVPVITTAPPPWEGQRKRESESALRWLRTRRHWTVPAAVPLAALGAAAVVARLPEVPQVALIAFAWAFAAAVALFARHKWTDASGEPRWPEVIYAIASAVTAAGWLTAACFTGVTIWSLVPLAALGLAWGVPWWWHKRPRGARKRAALIAKWDGWWQSLALHWGLGGSAVIGVSPMGVTTRLRIQGLPGRHSIQHVRQVMHLIESGLDGYADIGMIRAEPVKGKPSQFDLFLKKENPLRRPVNYDLALAPRSVHEPLVKGLAETGAWKTVSARRNTFTIGETRSGKSNDLLVKLAQLTGCSDDWQILIDLKGGRSARPVLRAGAAGYVVTEVDEARMTLRMLGAEATARAKHAYVDEEEQLLASDEIPALHCMVDETHGLTSVANGDTECVRLMGIVASQGNGLEIYLDVYTQHGSLEESVRTEQIRANLPQRTVYRVAEARHGAYVIPEYHKLDASRLEEKGTCYLKDGKEAFPEQVRAPHMPHALLRQVATANAALVAGRPALRLYCGAEMSPAGITWQEWWDTRWLRLDPAFRRDSPQYAAAVAAYSPAAEPTLTTAATAPAAAGDADARTAAAQIEAELAALPAADTLPGVNLRPVIAAQEEAFAAALEGASPGGISPRQLQEESGRGRTWIHQMLNALMETGATTQVGRGRYAPVPGVSIAQAMAMIAARNDQLYREARTLVNAA